MMPAATVVAHFAILAVWAACAAVTMGVGLLVLRPLAARPGDGAVSGFAAIWTGLAAIVLFLQAWHFAFPVDGRALGIIVAAGVTGLALAAPEVGRWLRRRTTEPGAVLRSSLLIGTALWLADRSLALPAAHDSEMYMIPGVEWAKAFPVVPGLGALHGRLAFNSSNVLLGALLEAGPWPPASPHLLNGFFLALLAGRVASRCGRPVATTSAAAVHAFDLVLIAPLVALALDDQLLPGLSADVGVAVALFAGASLLLERLAAGTGEARRPDVPLAAAAALALAVTLKLSAVAFAVAGCVTAFALLASDVRAGLVVRRVAVATVLFLVLLTGTWMARGIVTSGYPFYPSTLLAAPVDWRLPPEQAQAEAAWIAHFARTSYSPALANADRVAEYEWLRFRWLRPWLVSLAGRDIGLILLPLVCALLFGAGLLARRRTAGPTRASLPIASSAVAGLAFWFLTAPRPSLGLAAAWVAAALAVAAFLSGMRPRLTVRLARALTVLLVTMIAANAVRHHADRNVGPLRAVRSALLAWADPDDWFREQPARDLVEFRTESGLLLRVPARGNLCRRAALPCTPHPAANLRLRRPGNPAGGFVIEGAWQPRRWPNPASRFLEGWRKRPGH